MALAVCLLFDSRGETAMRRLWDRLEDAGVPTLRSHTHGRHHPHLSYAVLLEWDLARVRAALRPLPAAEPVTLSFHAVATFRRGRTWLVPGVTSALTLRQERVYAALHGTGAVLHHHYGPGRWVPHCSLAPRARLEQLPAVTAVVNDVLPLTVTAERAALVDSATGTATPLPQLL
ncbi:MAG: 2'-5' RNA ligase family protein [Actinomycetota bacterium]|nr:2'-5' RNA ligase family protein [Actinomycetota bacterium]